MLFQLIRTAIWREKCCNSPGKDKHTKKNDISSQPVDVWHLITIDSTVRSTVQDISASTQTSGKIHIHVTDTERFRCITTECLSVQNKCVFKHCHLLSVECYWAHRQMRDCLTLIYIYNISSNMYDYVRNHHYPYVPMMFLMSLLLLKIQEKQQYCEI